jgi:hypothetical protein
VPKAPELKPDEEKALKDMAEKARLMVEDMKSDPEKVRARAPARARVAGRRGRGRVCWKGHLISGLNPKPESSTLDCSDSTAEL